MPTGCPTSTGWPRRADEAGDGDPDDRGPSPCAPTTAARPGGWSPVSLPDGNVALSSAATWPATRRPSAGWSRIEIVVGLIVLTLLGVAGYLLVRNSLRPLAEVERTAQAIAAGDLSQRVPEGDQRTEVGRLSTALNGMLARIESAFRAQQASEAEARGSEERMRRFVADASHELRTPLTSIRGFAELYRQGAVALRRGRARG